ncbi:hypothetical protein [Gordonia rubripertincta]|uniref:Uncharacterized protein n=1 Tax=Gordonia rubripertincta TaxID=36822 RepID=A0ABT4N2L0_GORRU|nr:hypothetical protein [Gordonia rubripertincta]MCZ4552157.1 hypothetical protein [Gordonia rubripertincta]
MSPSQVDTSAATSRGRSGWLGHVIDVEVDQYADFDSTYVLSVLPVAFIVDEAW